MQRARIRESIEMTMQRFLNNLKLPIKSIVRHHKYETMNELLHHAREAESQLAKEAKSRTRFPSSNRFSARPIPPTAASPAVVPFTPSSKPASTPSFGSNARKPASPAASSGSNMSTARTRDVVCHTCGGRGHYKKDCPNSKVMFVNEQGEVENGDEASGDDIDDGEDGADAYAERAPTIVVSSRVLSVQPVEESQHSNLFQTKSLVGPNKACKVIIDGGSCRNLASKELCAKLNLTYLPHPKPYYIQCLSNNGEMKVNHMV